MTEPEALAVSDVEDTGASVDVVGTQDWFTGAGVVEFLRSAGGSQYWSGRAGAPILHVLVSGLKLDPAGHIGALAVLNEGLVESIQVPLLIANVCPLGQVGLVST
jgi:hypothetical protein